MSLSSSNASSRNASLPTFTFPANRANLEFDLEHHLTTTLHLIEIHGPYSFDFPDFARNPHHPRSPQALENLEPKSYAAADDALFTLETGLVCGSGWADLAAFEALRRVACVLLWALLRAHDEVGLETEVWAWAVLGVAASWVGEKLAGFDARRAKLHALLKLPEADRHQKHWGQVRVVGTVLVEKLVENEGSLRTWHLLQVLARLLEALGREVMVEELDWAVVAAGWRLPGEEKGDGVEEVEIGGEEEGEDAVP